jgi:hypothetical protein
MKNILLILTLVIAFQGYTQIAPPEKKNMSYRRYFRKMSKYQILSLKEGTLLVRLHTKASTIAALRKNGNDKEADNLELKQVVMNQSIVNAFREKFSFCPVYFFYSYDSPFVNEKQFDKITFLNDHLKTDTTIKFAGKYYLTAEFGTIDQDTTARFDSYYYDRGENGLEKRTLYYGGSNMGFGALIIKSDIFVQLHKPFPYYVRTFETVPFVVNTNHIVAKMNKKLNKYYLRKSKRK